MAGMHNQKPRLLGQGIVSCCVVQSSAALTAGAALFAAGMTVSAGLRAVQLAVLLNSSLWSDSAATGLTGAGGGRDRHQHFSFLVFL